MCACAVFMKRIGILGGTFNPIHIGHLAIAQVAQDKFDLEKVVFVPSYRPPHKKIANLASAKDRFNMVRLSIKSNPRFEISGFEIKKEGKSYTIDTVKHFRGLFPKKTKLFFIIGGDMAFDLYTWKDIKEILKRVTFIVINRPGHDDPKGKIKYLSAAMPGIDISSSYIRRCIIQRKSIKYLVPEGAFQYIKHHRLYRIHK